MGQNTKGRRQDIEDADADDEDDGDRDVVDDDDTVQVCFACDTYGGWTLIICNFHAFAASSGTYYNTEMFVMMMRKVDTVAQAVHNQGQLLLRQMQDNQEFQSVISRVCMVLDSHHRRQAIHLRAVARYAWRWL